MFSFSQKKLCTTSLIGLMTISVFLMTTPVQAHPPGPHPGWFWDGPGHGRHHGPFLPDGAAFAVIAGMTYAIIDGQYYRHQGNQYIYVGDSPVPSQTTVVVHSSDNNTSSESISNNQDTLFSPGTIVSQLPEKYKKVTINHQQYFVSHHTWFVKLANRGYVVVKPQL